MYFTAPPGVCLNRFHRESPGLKPLSLHRLLHQVRDPLWARAHQLLALQAAVDDAVPPELRGAVLVAGWRDGVLELACGSGALAARLRQSAPLLDKALAAQGGVREMRVRVMPHLQINRPLRAARAPLSEATLQELDQAARMLPDGPLKAALARMVLHHRQGWRGGKGE